ncbi:MAG: hypothetical protein V1859_02505 [archaeon]
MDKKIRTGLIRGFILFALFMALTLFSSSEDVKNSDFQGIMWFFTFLLFIGSILLIATSWGAHLKSQLNNKK